ncbi:glutathione transferase GstA [Pseudogulbenkiania sp. MAI-1]|uniref:glutathione transferase GstA n=1 Tax=Pseudogulbenkiania sp. MAI-1 TaxID=990370 RepID=UPI00045E886F|nr:glutathione transferase GstA [Pseudogulbenkiania sp. MAI-1]
MKLYLAPGACSLAPHIALHEAGLPFDTEGVDLRETPHRTEGGADYTMINPKGYVPALEFDHGDVLTECAAILQFIADQAPEMRLAPPNGTLERYRLQEWLNFISAELHKGFGPMWDPSARDDMREAAWARISRRLDWIAPQLAERDYLMGDFSVADAYLYTILNWTHYHKLPLDKWPALQDFMARMAARPAVQQALREEGLLQ